MNMQLSNMNNKLLIMNSIALKYLTMIIHLASSIFDYPAVGVKTKGKHQSAIFYCLEISNNLM